MAEIATIVLAAGLGTRFGPEPKMLALLDGKPLVRHAAEAALAAGPRPVVVVLGAHAAAVRAALAGLAVTLVENPHFRDGLATSLRVGVAALPPDFEVIVVVLGDMPRIAAEHIDRLAAAFEGSSKDLAAVVPVLDGRRGNPVLLNLRLLAAEIAHLKGDRGAGPLLKGRPDILEIPGDAATALDIDTPAALRAAERP